MVGKGEFIGHEQYCSYVSFGAECCKSVMLASDTLEADDVISQHTQSDKCTSPPTTILN